MLKSPATGIKKLAQMPVRGMDNLHNTPGFTLLTAVYPVVSREIKKALPWPVAGPETADNQGNCIISLN
ncbi:hypothetical protein GCM10009413_16890 [Tatumella punctata]